MTFQELNTLHHIFELGRTQLLTILAMSAQNPQLAGYLLTANLSNFLLRKALLFGYKTVFIFSRRRMKLINFLTVHQYTIKLLKGIVIQQQDKLSNMLPLYLVITIHRMS